MSRYAEGTTVSVESSQLEIRRALKRYGADNITFWENDAGSFAVQFSFGGRVLRFSMDTPPLSTFRLDGRGRWRRESEQKKAREAEHLRLWRVLLLVVKSQLELTREEGIDTDAALIGWMVLNTGETVAEAMKPRIAAALAAGVMPTGELFPKLLPSPTDGGERS